MKASFLIVLNSLMMFGCSLSNESTQDSNEIAGIYTKEKTFSQHHLATGEFVGTVRVRDTIFISAVSEGYQVRIQKWRLNDYDEKGWVAQAGITDGSIPAYTTIFEKSSATLQPETGIFPVIQLKAKERLIYAGKNLSEPYRKVD